MTNPLEGQLNKLLDTFDQEQQAQKRTKETIAANQEDAFLAIFNNFRTITAQPMFERVGDHLRSLGHDYEITTQDREDGDDGKLFEANISLIIYQSGTTRHNYRRVQYPSFTIIASCSGQKVWMHGRMTGPDSSGPRGSYKLDQLTSALLKQVLIKYLAELFDGRELTHSER